ncbi:hypothetical protein AAE478_009145 [Parahypoxylon ruwenzoriense]
MLLLILSVAIVTSIGSTWGVSLRANAGCGFRLTTVGGFNGSVGQLADGQVRAGSELASSLFTWFGDDFVDQQGRGCWWTPPTYVLQCDTNQEPDHGFEIGCYGGISYNEQSTFYECRTGDGDEVNIYLQPNGADCSKITLHADSCRPPCAGKDTSRSSGPTASPNPTQAPLQIPTSTASLLRSTQTTSTSSSSRTPGHCDVVVAEAPDEIVLIDKSNPDTSYGPNPDMIMQLSPNTSAVFTFRFKAADEGKQCGLVFNLPSQQPPYYQLTGRGKVGFAVLDGPPEDAVSTTYSNKPGVAMALEAVTLSPGISVEPLEFPCPGEDGEVAFMMRDEDGSATCLEYQQKVTEVLIGLYLVKC